MNCARTISLSCKIERGRGSEDEEGGQNEGFGMFSLSVCLSLCIIDEPALALFVLLACFGCYQAVCKVGLVIDR